MLKKFGAFRVALVCSVFLLIILISHRLVTTTSFEHSPLKSFGRTIQSWKYGDEGIDKVEITDLFNTTELPLTAQIQQIIADQRKKIEYEMINYNYPNGKYNISARYLTDLVPELGGNPIRNIVVTTWRSGSTFLGDILNSHPANFYHYEPLLDYNIIQIRGPPYAQKALNSLKNLLTCNYTNLDDYLNYGKGHVWLFNHNTRLWDQCEQHQSVCWLPEFLGPFCNLFPFQSMKIVRLRLRLVEQLLNDKRLNVRVLFLVRDPRGTLQSRKHRKWCPGQPDCDEPSLLCADLVSDYGASSQFIVKYPGRFTVLRYEDLSLDPYSSAKKIFQFFGLDFHSNVVQFLDTHTKENVGGVSSTYRDSKLAPFHWRQDLTHEEVRQIQEVCGLAMKYWGYIKAESATEQRFFNPIVNFTLFCPDNIQNNSKNCTLSKS